MLFFNNYQPPTSKKNTKTPHPGNFLAILCGLFFGNGGAPIGWGEGESPSAMSTPNIQSSLSLPSLSSASGTPCTTRSRSKGKWVPATPWWGWMCQLQSCDGDYLVVPLVEPDGIHCITCITITLLCFNYIASCTYLHGLNLKILVCDHSLTIVFNVNGGRIEKVMYSNRTSDCKSIMFVPLFFCGWKKCIR